MTKPSFNSDFISPELIRSNLFLSHFPVCRINKRNLVPVETNLLEREMLNSDRNYILDCGTEVFLWMGMTTLVSERRTSVTALEVRWNMIMFLFIIIQCSYNHVVVFLE